MKKFILTFCLILGFQAIGFADSQVAFLDNELKPEFLPSVSDAGESQNKENLPKANATQKTRIFVGDLIVNSLQILGAAIVFLIILYGFKMVIAFGNDEQIAESKKALGYLVAGFVLIMLSYSITKFILEFTLVPQEIQESTQRSNTQSGQTGSGSGTGS